MRTQFLALSLVLITSCVTPQAFIPPGRTVNFNQYRAAKLVVVDSVNSPYSKEGIPMFEGLLRRRFKSLGFSLVEKDEDLRIEVNITSFEPGSRATRLIVGFGAGRAVLTYRAIFKERDGNVVAEFEGGKSYHGGELTLKENSMFMTDEEIKMGMIQQSVIQVGQFIKDNSLQVAAQPSTKVTLVNPKTGESVTCPWEGIVARSITEEQAAQQRTWHAEFQRTYNRLPTPMEGCLKENEISGFVRAATEEPLRQNVAPAERLYTNPVYRWSISYPGSWTIDSGDLSFVRIASSADNALCGIQSGAVPFKTVDEFMHTTLVNDKRFFKGQVFRIPAWRQISLPNDIIGNDVVTGFGDGGKSRRIYILADGRGFIIDCETYVKDWERLEPFYDRIIRSFTLGK